MNYALHLVGSIAVFATLACGLSLVVGLGNILLLSYPTFVALGAYAYALMRISAGMDAATGLFVAAMVGGVASAASAAAFARLRGDRLVLSTLAVNAIGVSIFLNWADTAHPLGSYSNMTNGSFGISSIPTLAASGRGAILALSVVAALAVFCARWIRVSTFGKLAVAVRDDELAARGLGLESDSIRLILQVISGVIGAVGGALYASHFRYLDPSIASVDAGTAVLAIAVVGGRHPVWGPTLGAGFFVLLPELLRALTVTDTVAANVRAGVVGICLLAAILIRARANRNARSYVL